jgi:hypothetical protein
LASIQTQGDSQFYQVQEVTGVPGFNVEIEFAVTGDFNQLYLDSRYQGNPAHLVNIDLWNYNTSAWNTFKTISNEADYVIKAIDILDPMHYVSANVVRCRIYHSSSGNASHNLYIDYATVRRSVRGANGIDGIDGIDGFDGASIVSATFVANDMVFTKDDATTVTLVNAKVDLKGEQGIQGIQGIPGASATVVTDTIVFANESNYETKVISHANISPTSTILVSLDGIEDVLLQSLTAGVISKGEGGCTIAVGTPHGATGTYNLTIQIFN